MVKREREIELPRVWVKFLGGGGGGGLDFGLTSTVGVL